MVTNSLISDHDESQPGTSNIQHLTPPEQLIMPEGLFDQAVNQRQPHKPHQERDPPDHGVVTQQTEILAEMMAELRARQPAVQPVNPAEPSRDPAFDWTSLALPSVTDFQVPGTGLVQRMASSLFARVPTVGWTLGMMREPGPFRGFMYIVLWQLWVGLRLRQRAPHQLQPLTLSSHRARCSHNKNLRDSAETAGNNQRQQPHKQQLQLHHLNSNSAEEVTEETINPEVAEEDANNVKFLFFITLFTALRPSADRVPVLLVLETALIVSLLLTHRP